MHFRSIQEYLRFMKSKPEDYREPKEYVEPVPEKPKRGKKAKDGEVLQVD